MKKKIMKYTCFIATALFMTAALLGGSNTETSGRFLKTAYAETATHKITINQTSGITITATTFNGSEEIAADEVSVGRNVMLYYTLDEGSSRTFGGYIVTYEDSNGETHSVEFVENWTNLFIMPDGDVTVTPVFLISSWAELQEAIDNAENGDTIVLSTKENCEYIAQAGDKPITIPENKSITLDLNGADIDRNALSSSSSADGCAIKLESGSQLLIKNSSITDGHITGGNGTNGGGICNNGGRLYIYDGVVISGNKAENGGGIYGGAIYGSSTTLDGGSVTDNTASKSGGGIAMYSSLDLYDCYISGNTAKSGGGIYADGKLSLYSGAPVIKENTSSDGIDNVYLPDGKEITVWGQIGSNADIGISSGERSNPITFNYGTYNRNLDPIDVFTVNNGYETLLKDNEVYIGKTYTVKTGSGLTDRVKLDRTAAAKGRTVTVTALDDNVSDLFIYDGKKYTAISSDDGNKTFKFTMPEANVTVVTRDPVNYYDGQNGSTKPLVTGYTPVTSTTTTLTNGWYVVSEDVTISDRIEVSGDDVNLLILGTSDSSRATLTALKGIHVGSGNNLSIYGETQENGQLIAGNTDTGNTYYGHAAIGGNTQELCGTIEIHSGFVSAYGKSDSSGIGNGSSNLSRTGGKVIIYDGLVGAFGGNDSAGIGGGHDANGCTVEIYNGTVVAQGGVYAAGIGGGLKGSSYFVTIYGGDVTAISCGYAAGIGNGYCNNAPQNVLNINIDIQGGTVTSYVLAAEGDAAAFCTATISTEFVGARPSQLELGLAVAKDLKIYVGGSRTGTFAVGQFNSMPDNAAITKNRNDLFEYRWAKIEPCSHSNSSYKITGTGHTLVCKDCAETFTEDSHIYGTDGKCTVCGYATNDLIVTLDPNNGDQPYSQAVKSGSTATRPEDPDKKGYALKGWYVDNTEFDFTAPVTESVTVTAVWEDIAGDINFDGVCDKQDAALLLKYIIGTVELDDKELARADVNGDGKADMLDVIAIMKIMETEK